MRHLDDVALSALSRREPEAVAYFAEHLAHPCDTCEAFLAAHAGPGLLDGQVDALLLGLAPPAASAAPLDEVGLARVRRALRTHPPAARRWGLVAGGLAACVLALVLLPRMRAEAPGPQTGAPGPWTGEKGRVAHIALELSVAARASDGVLRRLDPGSRVEDSDVLLLRYHATEAGSALLFVQRQGEPPELLGQFPLTAGTHDLRGPQGLAGVSLTGETGPVTLWLVGAAGAPPDTRVVREMLEGQTAPGALAVIRFDVSVRSGQNRP
ncbi:hypothetical protein [Corallococcus macrosporus]|uniref:Uncharacterized protein n=1 Tax=Myxococcus fulvus (strain ATCC BAA-855 / HW-1) TaxID=483219 RepID=F8CB34_MYXFH|nr:hypothetical protein [Corallococcus macrosporus]AEI68415.1 hypothetical protein LILAB_32670 [Corallococcus macrosporus]